MNISIIKRRNIILMASSMAATYSVVSCSEAFRLLRASTEMVAVLLYSPLEFKVALIFAVLFVVFTVLTHYTLVYAGTGGLNLLSFVSGLSDITPFILNLLQNTGNIAALVVTACCMQAIISNILVNMFYALFFVGKGSRLRPWILKGFGVVIGCNLVLLLFFYL
mgnify:CR=1 FL=1